MIQFNEINRNTFLQDYWQKKTLVLRQAMPNFTNPISPDELAGLAMEEDIESRMVIETPDKKPYWHLKKGPFLESDFHSMPATHWTLLVQGVDRFVPEIYRLLDHFNFIPQWRIDDVMISYAVSHGSVGPHYDNYDVFLYQAMGRRKWSLTTQQCTPENAMEDIELRLMSNFIIEEEYILEEGDLLYLPPHIGHYGVSLSEECMTYSFGYRSYPVQELLEHFGEYLLDNPMMKELYIDPDWSNLKYSSELPKAAWKNAQTLLLKLVNDEQLIRSWFGCFTTRLDQQAEQLLLDYGSPEVTLDTTLDINVFKTTPFEREPCCRIAYAMNADEKGLSLYVNGDEWDVRAIEPDLIAYIANNRYYAFGKEPHYLENKNNLEFLNRLWKMGLIVEQSVE